MGPRKRAVPGNQDLLMQTFMNVVGVLIVLLALMQMRARDAVSQTTPQPQGGSAKQFGEAQQQFAKARADIERLKKEVEATEANVLDSRRKLETNRTEILVLKPNVELPVPSDDDADVKALRAKVAAQQKRADELQAGVEKARAETAALHVRLDETPRPPGTPEPISVVPPNPRPAPRNSDVMDFVCRNGRIAPVSKDAVLRRMAQERIESKKKELGREKSIDCEALTKLFETEDIGTKFFRLKIVRDARRPKLVVEYRPNSGVTADEFATLFQEYAKGLNVQKNWFRFRVYPDSFGTYLAARDVLRNRFKGFQAGWVPIPDKSVHEIDLQLAGDLPCSAPDPALPLVPVPDKLIDVESVGKKLQSQVKGSIEKNAKKKKPKEAATKEHAKNPAGKDQGKGPPAKSKDAKSQAQSKTEQPVQTLKVEIPTTPASSNVPNDDVD